MLSVFALLRFARADEGSGEGFGFGGESGGLSPAGDAFGIGFNSFFNQIANRGATSGPAMFSTSTAGNGPLLGQLSLLISAPPAPPSPVSGALSIFDRNAELLLQWRNAHPENPEQPLRMLELCKSFGINDKKAWIDSGKVKLGEFAHAVARGSLLAGSNKCNVFIAEMALKAGMEPMYGPDRLFANTTTMLSGAEFRCWKRTDIPHKANLGVYPNHVFIVDDPNTGTGISAGSRIVQELPHFTRDQAGHFHPTTTVTNKKTAEVNQIDVIFFEYNCPDIRTTTASKAE